MPALSLHAVLRLEAVSAHGIEDEVNKDPGSAQEPSVWFSHTGIGDNSDQELTPTLV